MDAPEPSPGAPARTVWDPASGRRVAAADLAVGSGRRRPGGTSALKVLAIVVVGAAVVAGSSAAVLTFASGRGGAPARSEDDRVATVADLAASARPWVVTVVTPQGGAGDPVASSGFSGVVVGSDGLIVTVAGAASSDEIEVVFPDTSRAAATVVAVDTRAGLAVLRAPAGSAGIAVLGTASDLRPGQTLVAVGSPSGRPVVAAGQVAALSRPAPHGTSLPPADLVALTESFAGAGPGAVVVGSGGAAVGVAVGASGGAAYVIPIDIVRAVLKRTTEGLPPSWPWLGLEVEALDDESSFRLGIRGLVVLDARGPAAEAGLKRGDVIVGIDGIEINGGLALLRAVWDAGVGSELELLVRRGDDESAVVVGIRDRPAGS